MTVRNPTRICGVTADESREYILELHRRAWVHVDATIDALALDTTGRVPRGGPTAGTR
jgi:hypothetical protein